MELACGHITKNIYYQMKKTNNIVICFALLIPALVKAQTKYYDASAFPLIGKISDSTETRYERLPAYLRGKTTRPAIWQLGKNCSGLAIRFRSNSTSISAKWELLENVSMNHMTETGIKGLDLYAWSKDHWQFVNTGRPNGKVNDKVIISNMSPDEREYLLFLPLYDGMTSLSIGIDSTASISQPELNLPNTKSPIIYYGTSISQGGCASRPGMSGTNILTRWLNREFINLGFSGNGQLDYEIAGVMAKRHDAALFVLDFIPNVNNRQIIDKMENFIKIIRDENPDTPILLVESVIFPHSVYDMSIRKVVNEKDSLLREEYIKLRKKGDKHLYYLSSENLIGNDGEATVDGIHLTDLGFMRSSKIIYKAIKRIL